MKKMVALILALTMVGIMAGCSTNDETGSQAGEKIVWYVGGDTQSDLSSVLKVFNEKLYEKNGTQLELKFVDWGNYNDKMNMVLSSGENFDLCFTSTWSNNFLMNASGGAYLDLNSYLDGSHAGLKASIPDFVWDDAKVNGSIYAVPNYQVSYYQECALTPKRLADKYNLDVSSIKNLSDLEPYLKQLKENEPDIYPLNPANFTANTINYKSLPSIPSLAVNTAEGENKLYSKYETPEYKEMLLLFRDYFNKGYIRPDMLSAVNNATSDTLNMKYGVWCSSCKPGSEVDNLQYYGEEMVEIPLQEPYVAMGAAQAAMTAVSKNSKHPEKALELLQIINTDKEMYNLLCFGLEGKHYNKVKDDVVKLVDNSGYAPGAAWVFGNQFNAYYIDGQAEGIWEETDKINREAARSIYRGFTVDFSKIKSDVAKLSAVENEYKYITLGTEDPEAPLQEFIQKLKTAGLDDIYTEVQKQMNDFLANQQ
jgi:putative aldouronate transport system substrate-binding protein